MALMVVTKYRGEICRVPYGRLGLSAFVASRVIAIVGGGAVGWLAARSAYYSDDVPAGLRLVFVLAGAYIISGVFRAFIPGRVWVTRKPHSD